MLLAGLITTTTRKLDREQQSEHFLEVQNNLANFYNFVIFPSPHIPQLRGWGGGGVTDPYGFHKL